MTDYFAVLGLKRWASDREIRMAYRRLAKMYHPDSNHSDPETVRRMQEINAAKAVLFDPVKREEHRQTLGLREKLTAQRLDEIRKEPRFEPVRPTPSAPPPPIRFAARPTSKWDHAWKRYLIWICALVGLGASAMVVAEVMNEVPPPANPVEAIVVRHHEMQRPLFGGDVRDEHRAASVADSIPLTPEASQHLRSAGDLYYTIHEYGPAAECYERYLQLEPDDQPIVKRLAEAYFRTGRFAESMEVISQQMHGDSDLVVAYYTTGQAFLRVDKPMDARDAFHAAVKVADSMALDGHRPPAAANLARNELAKLE